jgi:hypothetical protein
MRGNARNMLLTRGAPKPRARTGSAHGLGLPAKAEKLRHMLVIAEESGLLRGTRTKVIRGRMPEALVNKAKARTGITSDTDLLEVALASLAVADEYPEWLLSRKGRIPQDADLEF